MKNCHFSLALRETPKWTPTLGNANSIYIGQLGTTKLTKKCLSRLNIIRDERKADLDQIYSIN